MIRFKRNGTDVIIEVDSDLGVTKPVYIFTYPCDNENEAELLLNHLDNKYSNMREEDYDLGVQEACEAANVKTD